jgi:hypothetical protein
MPVRRSFLLDLCFCDLTGPWLCLESCGRTVDLPFRHVARQRPTALLGDLLSALRRRECGRRPGRVNLPDDLADRVAARPGSPGGWRIEIVLPDREN